MTYVKSECSKSLEKTRNIVIMMSLIPLLLSGNTQSPIGLLDKIFDRIREQIRKLWMHFSIAL